MELFLRKLAACQLFRICKWGFFLVVAVNAVRTGHEADGNLLRLGLFTCFGPIIAPVQSV